MAVVMLLNNRVGKVSRRRDKFRCYIFKQLFLRIKEK